MADIASNSNARKVARAVSDIQDDAAIVAAATALNDHQFLGVPVYRKVLTVAAGPNNSTVNTAHGITSPVRILGCQVVLKSGTTHLCFDGGGWFSGALATSIVVALGGTNVGLTSGSGGDYSGYAGYIVLLYTLA